MSMLSNRLLPSACEVDVMGAVSMYALTQAAASPSMLLDWNNNYGDDPDKCVLFHCSNLPRDVFVDDQPVMDYQAIIAEAVGQTCTYGTMTGRVQAGPLTYLRLTTDDYNGDIRGFVGEGEFTDDELDTFGGYGVAQIDDLQDLLQHICENAYEHHVAANLSHCAEAVYEALDKYLDWEMYLHE
jgi:L-fucose isomerase-like protein